ncbi:DNA polymerase/3'-5' exonuclease PolX [Thermogemmata fonticola]|uniref:DNA polymerase beta n=1 Tax=Thermogemmata fonticola TaxID=2755323 RepID=A0A7V8VDP4_9BACT|nr:DNA polymerase/3'-5' exonuclease PolX [Thermogemmata fonticola]MBA2226125.1 DNA polymerase/3'-5' exonuclease PolX [Thermogemmata fonticola]
MTKEEVAAALDEIGTLLELKGENPFRCNAYHQAARMIQQLEGDLHELVASGKLAEVRGIGEALQEKIATLVTTGRLSFLDELRASVPAGMVQMLRIPGLGPKKVKALYEQLHVRDIGELKAACERGEVARLKGFGDKTQAKILEGIEFLQRQGQRVRLDQALPLAEELMEQLRRGGHVQQIAVCGSVRRRRETVHDLDILVCSEAPQPVMDRFVRLPQVQQVLAQGPTRSSVVLVQHIQGEKITLQADLRIVTPSQYPYALLYFTGSKEHNIRLRQRALSRGWTLNEYMMGTESQPILAKTEEEIYAALGLAYIPPELREDTGEIEAAERGELPVLVEESDLRGVFHCHTTASDGRATLEEMALAAERLGLEYLGIADHSQSLTVAGGLSPQAVRDQWQQIDRLNARLHKVRLLKGTEVDILDDGSLDYPDELLAGFDYVVASVHTHFQMSREAMTARVCKALAHPAVTMLGHPTGRLLLKRDGYKIDLEAVLRTAAQYGKMIEINAQPQRLDLDWLHVKQARALGVPLVINPDAHALPELEYVRYGVMVARRGWLERRQVFNTRSLPEVLEELQRRKQAWLSASPARKKSAHRSH